MKLWLRNIGFAAMIVAVLALILMILLAIVSGDMDTASRLLHDLVFILAGFLAGYHFSSFTET